MDKIHIVSKEYYLKHKTLGKLKKILIPKLKFPNIRHQFYMTTTGTCFIYLQELGFLLVPEDSGLSEDVLLRDVDSREWYIEKYSNPDIKFTLNYIRAFPDVSIRNTKEWIQDYSGWLRVWNTLTHEDFIFYKTAPSEIYNNTNQKSYICKLVTGSEVKFPIDVYKAKEFNNLMKDILEWI